jgi:thiol-disulfide isomerase/thioredoxin
VDPSPTIGKALVPILRSPRMIAASGVLAVVLAVGGGLAGCATSSAGTSDQQTGYIAGKGVVTTYAVGHRKLAPAVSGKDLSGSVLSLSQFAGKVVVLNFWASWCPPCRSEAAALQQLSTDTSSIGVQFVGVDIREYGTSDGAHFVATHKVDYPSFADQSTRIALAFRGSGITPETTPSTLVIDRQGRVAARGLGEMTYSKLAPIVQAVAKEAA